MLAKIHGMVFIGAVFFVLGSSSLASASEYRAGELIVKYRNGVLRTRDGMNALYDAAGVRKVRRYSSRMGSMEHVLLSDGTKAEDAMAAFSRDPSVEFVQPNYIVTTMPVMRADSAHQVHIGLGTPCVPGLNIPGCTPPGNSGPLPPEFPLPPLSPQPPLTVARPALKAAPTDTSPPIEDTEMDKVYGLDSINAVEAWNLTRGSKRIVVADIDTGIDYNHEDLAFNLWRNPHPGPKHDVVGYDFVHGDGLPYDDNQHGTHTAGTIGAVGGNGIGISGVAQRVSLMALKFLAMDGSGSTADAIKAIDYAIAHGAKILNNSWGGYGDENNNGLKAAIESAEAHGVLFVAAAGNGDKYGYAVDNDGSNPSYPASFKIDNIISVAAVDSNDQIARFSNYGAKSVHLAAPGVGIYSTIPGDRYTSLDGTSMACPHVSGAAALIWSAHPHWTYRQVKHALLSSVDHVPSLEGKTITGGRLNVLNALLQAAQHDETLADPQ